MRDTHRERERLAETQREKQAPCREPNVGLDPGTPGSRPGPEAGAKPLSHPGIPPSKILKSISVSEPKMLLRSPAISTPEGNQAHVSDARATSSHNMHKSRIGHPAGSLLLPLPVSLPLSLFLCVSHE